MARATVQTALLPDLPVRCCQPRRRSPGPADQGADPARCHWIGKATEPAERLSATQFVVTLAVDRAIGSADAAA